MLHCTETDYQTDVQPSPPSPPFHLMPFFISFSSPRLPHQHHHHLRLPIFVSSLTYILPCMSPVSSLTLSFAPPRSAPWRIIPALPHPHLPIKDSVVVNQHLGRRVEGESLGKVAAVLVGWGGVTRMYQHHRQLPLENSVHKHDLTVFHFLFSYSSLFVP